MNRCWACESYVELPELFCNEHKDIERAILIMHEERKQWLKRILQS